VRPLRIFAVVAASIGISVADSGFRAGAFAVDITPTDFPVIVNGGFLERVATEARDRLYARAIVMESGATRIVLVVADSCMMPRDLLDRAKEIAAMRTGIPIHRMLISATHTHSAPAAMGCLGSDADSKYAATLPMRIAEAIDGAARRTVPARAGWTTIDDFEHTHNRRWILRPDRMKTDPFGGLTVRANMHPGYENPDAIAPSGPVDPSIAMLSLRSTEGKPIALLANYSMHYFGAPAVSSDYYGLFAAAMEKRIGGGMAIMSQGTSGDQMWMDYSRPKSDITLEAYAGEVAAVAFSAYQNIRYDTSPALAMAEAKITLRRRVPDSARLHWARDLLGQSGGTKPRNQQEVYAREQILLHSDPVRELKLQALRVGELGITAIPNEVFAITGLKLKAQSPLRPTFNIELANGAEGYIPPPEQHKLGGYTTWPARTASLETEAEPKIVEALLELLETVAGKPRRKDVESNGAYPRAVLAARPEAYWRMSEFGGAVAADAAGRQPGSYSNGVAYYVEGPVSAAFSGDEVNRSVHLAGGWFNAPMRQPQHAYTLEMWFWNGLPNDARMNTGHLIAWGGDRLSIAGQGPSAGRLSFGGVAGRTQITPKTWNYLAVVRDGDAVRVYLNGKLDMTAKSAAAPGANLLIGGTGDGTDTLEGRIDEVTVYSRAVRPGEILTRYALGTR
jgi:hypothetical protein